ncbi:MAG: M48 family metallopeptidase [Oligoflexia bacterium]|nr:M48 family metallopeptidase [Oligoflexia bacterium]
MTWLVALFLTSSFLLDLGIELLNLRHLRLEVPEEFRDVHEPEKYRTALRYQAEGTRFELLRRGTLLALLLGFLFAGGFETLDRTARALSGSPVIAGLIFVALLATLRFFAALPFAIHDTFVIEERYGFNRTTARTFVLDLVKGTLLSLLIGAPLLAGVFALFGSAGPEAWLPTWLLLTTAQLLLGFVAPAVILPLFNRFDPLPEGELALALRRYAAEHDFRLSGIFRMDSSRRSTKTNAFFTGFGRFRRLVLFDTLIERHTVAELVAVVAHEVGHFKRKHILKSLTLSVLSTGALLFAWSLLLWNPALFDAFGVREPSIYAGLVFVSILSSPFLRLLAIPANALSRKFEYEADEFARATTGDAPALAHALKKLSVDNLSNLTPHPWKVKLDYTHPPVLDRVRALRREERAR